MASISSPTRGLKLHLPWLTEARALANDTLLRLTPALRSSEREWFDVLLQSSSVSAGRIPEIPQDVFNPAETDSHSLVARSTGALPARPRNDLPSQMVFTDLASSLSKLPEKFRTILGSPPDLGKDAISQLVVSRADQGFFLYVPHGTQVRIPLRGLTWLDSSSPHFFHRTVIIAEPGSEVVYVDELAGSPELNEDSPAQNAAGLVQIIARPGSRVSYFQVQNWPLNVRHALRTSIHLERDAQVDCVSVTLGSAQGDARTESHLTGPGASMRMISAARGDDAQKFNFDVTTRHSAPDTTSTYDLLTVMADKAKAVFNGMIAITPGAARTDAYQRNRNMILSPQASVETNPKLEIATDDVKCAHGASVAPVSFDQLYYLQARGIPALEAELMIINGFTDPVVHRLPESAGIRRRVADSLEMKHGVHPCGVTPTLQEVQP